MRLATDGLAPTALPFSSRQRLETYAAHPSRHPMISQTCRRVFRYSVICIWFISASICLALLFRVPVIGSAQAAQDVPVDQLLKSVQKTLIRVRDKGDDVDLPKLTNVTLLLRTAVVEKAGGKMSLVVLDFGASASKETIQEIKLELGPPLLEDKSRVSAATDSLADAIVAAARSVTRAQKEDPPLHLRKLTASLQFVVKAEGEAGANFTLLPVTAALGGQVNQSNTQVVIIEFE